VIDKALALGWEPVELVGVQRATPHDHPSLAGLIFSMRPGDTVPDVRRSGCIIVYGNVRHIWRIVLPLDGSICLPGWRNDCSSPRAAQGCSTIGSNPLGAYTSADFSPMRPMKPQTPGTSPETYRRRRRKRAPGRR
jgi:hypothetical protein